ncbi:MAG TPA: lipase family protein [Pseudonocardiaceae bacterium]|jgi:hypothetical protein|nr:lipase family protein [Pseudonocardiaceae bacterium]
MALLAAVSLSTASAATPTAPTGSASASGVLPPSQDPFYDYDGSTPLSAIAPGTVLKTRTVQAHLEGLPLPVTTIQLLYRTTDSLGNPIVTVTSVLKPLVSSGTPKLLSYQSFYDSLSANCEPSYALAGGFDPGLISALENPLMIALLQTGYTISTADFEGQQADFADGRQYGMATLDGIRAALRSPDTGLNTGTKVGMMGYSGGAIATEWATELAPSYAPDVNSQLVGSSIGGVFVDPIHNLHYIDGSVVWTGVLPMALVGIARGYQVDLTPYLSAYAQSLIGQIQNDCLVDDLGHYPGLTFAKLTKPQYAQPESIPALVNISNQLIMGTGGTPTTPMLILQGAGGILEGTPNGGPGIGAGDGVMVAGDVRALANEYCSRGVNVNYQEFPLLSHTLTAVPWLAETLPWLQQRFAGAPASSTCGQIPPGNSIAPIQPTS